MKEKKRKSSGKKTLKKSTKGKESTTTENKSLMLKNSDLDVGGENPIVPLEPTQTYILRDFLHTNNILNQSMSLLHEQNKSSAADFEKEKDLGKKKELLDKAAYDARTNALALASVVQAKVQFIKAVRGIK